MRRRREVLALSIETLEKKILAWPLDEEGGREMLLP